MSRWLQESGGDRGDSYAERFTRLSAAGVAVHGEADFVTPLVSPGAAVLDAGCGTGRLGAELARRGFAVTGVDSDPSMLAVARRTAPDLDWRLGDLAELADAGAYDLVVAAGNVMVYLAEGTGPQVVAALARALRPGGLLVSGWRTEHAPEDGRPRLPVAEYEAWTEAAGLVPAGRYATWDGDPWETDAPWCVAVDRRPAGG